MIYPLQDIEADIVILGCGIQGIWLLADLVDRGYQAVALERAHPGCAQTGHSHVFLHGGHMRASARKNESLNEAIQRVMPLRDAHKRWMQELSEGRLKSVMPLKSRLYIGWTQEQKATLFRLVCEQANIDCTVVKSAPPMFADCSWMFETEGVCLESAAVLNALLHHKDLKGRIGTCEDVQLKIDLNGRMRLTLESQMSAGIEITCRGLVLSAGAGNERLVGEVLPAGGISLDPSHTRQQTIKTYMLVVRTPAGALDPACGMFLEFNGIFLAHRFDSDGSILWLVADRQRNHVRVPGEWTTLDARRWFQNLKPALAKLTPWLLQTPENYEWGIYEAPKAEPWTATDKYPNGGVFPDQYKVFKDPQHNVWVTWPTLLTFAPVVAETIVEEILGSSIQPSKEIVNRAIWDEVSDQVEPAQDRWHTTPLLDWQSFSRCYA